MSRLHLRPYLYLAGGVVLQGLSPVLTKLLLSEMSAEAVVAVRYFIAVLFLLPFGWRSTPPHPEALRPRRRDWVGLVLVGALGSGIATLLFTRAIELTSVGVATALSKTAPIFVAVFAYLTLKERITSARLLLVAVMVGADILIGAGELQAGATLADRLKGDFLAIGAGALRALAEVMGKASLRRFYPSTVALWRFGVGFLVTGLIALMGGDLGGLGTLDARAWLLLLVLGGLCTSLSMGLYYRGLRDIPAHVGMSLRLSGAIVTALASWWLLQEGLNALHIAGIAVLVAGSYLIVVRTARPVAGGPVPAAPEPARPTLTATLKGRIAVLVATMVALTVLASTLLSIGHSRQVINEHVRLTMVKTATNLLQLRGVSQAPSPETYRQYLDRVIHHRVQGRFYSLNIRYLIVLDGRGNVIAASHARDLVIPDAAGRPLTRTDNATSLRLLELADTPVWTRSEDIIPLSAELERGGQVIGLIKMGCTRSLAFRDSAEVALRNLTLAVLLSLVGVAVAFHLVGHLARPLERLTAAARRIAEGELETPVGPRGSLEVESLGEALGALVDDVRTGRAAAEFLAHQATAPGPGGPVIPAGAAALLVRLGPGAEAEHRWRRLLETMTLNEGRLASVAPGQVLGVWGGEAGEQDDLLRAAVAALEWLQESGDGEEGALLAVAPGSGSEDLRQQMANSLTVASGTGGRLLLTAQATAQLEGFVKTTALPGTPWRVVITEEADI